MYDCGVNVSVLQCSNYFFVPSPASRGTTDCTVSSVSESLVSISSFCGLYLTLLFFFLSHYALISFSPINFQLTTFVFCRSLFLCFKKYIFFGSIHMFCSSSICVSVWGGLKGHPFSHKGIFFFHSSLGFSPVNCLFVCLLVYV